MDRSATELLDEFDQIVSVRFDKMQPRTDSNLQTVTFDQAFYRSFGTLKRALSLARQGFVFETAMVARGFLEQLAWTRAASLCETEDDLFKINIHRSISKLKNLYPTAGFIYGVLSKFAHFDASRHDLFYASNNGKLATRFADVETKIIAMSWIFPLIDLWMAVFEEFYAEWDFQPEVWQPDNKFLQDRLTIRKFDEYFEGIDKAVVTSKSMFA